jgi:PAS domain-containing protein
VDAGRHTVLDVNAAALRLIGSRREDVVGQLCHSIMGGEAVRELSAKSNVPPGERAEGLLKRANGSTMPVLQTVAPTLLRNRSCLLVCVIDRTQQQVAEEQVKQSIEDMSRLNRSMIGREERVLDLKREVNALLTELGRAARYRAYEVPDNREAQ